MRELKPDETIQEGDFLKTPKPVGYDGATTDMLPAEFLKTLASGSFIGKPVKDADTWCGPNQCKWLRPE